MRARELLACAALAACLPAHAETFDALVQRCAPDVHPQTLRKLATVESSGNPFAISNWQGRQPRSRGEALDVIRQMMASGRGFAVGLVQIWHTNVAKYGHSFESILDACNNVRVGAQILKEGFALSTAGDEQLRTREALSRYYSGNPRRGFLPDRPGGTSYVQRVAASAGNVPAYAVPAIEPHPSDAVTAPLPSQSGAEAPVKVRPLSAPSAPPAARTVRQADPWMVTVGAPAAADAAGDAPQSGDWLVKVK